MKWRGRYGWIALGPTEDRVARYLDDATRHGRITRTTARIQDDLGLGRSEAFRILRTLRTLGLFGVENDQGGTRGGRRIWRIDRPGEGATLDAGRHRQAWARVVAYLAERKARALARLRSMTTRAAHPPRQGSRFPRRTLAPTSPGPDPQADVGPALTLGDAIRRWAPGLAHEWRLGSGDVA